MVNYAEPVKFQGFDVAERELLAHRLIHFHTIFQTDPCNEVGSPLDWIVGSQGSEIWTRRDIVT